MKAKYCENTLSRPPPRRVPGILKKNVMNTPSVLLPVIENNRTVTVQAIQQSILHFAEGLIPNQQNRLLKVIELIAGPAYAQDFIWFLNEAYRSLNWQLPALAGSQAINTPLIQQWFDLWLNAHSDMSMRWPVAADHQVRIYLSQGLCERLTLVMGNAMALDFAFIKRALSIPEAQTLSWSRFLTQVERWYSHAIKVWMVGNSVFFFGRCSVSHQKTTRPILLKEKNVQKNCNR